MGWDGIARQGRGVPTVPHIIIGIESWKLAIPTDLRNQILAPNWHERKNHLDLPLRNAPVELFRQGLACGGGNEKSPSKCNTLKGFVGPDGLECFPLIMSLLYSIYYLLRKNRDICVIFNIYSALCFYVSKINCSFYVKNYTGLHWFVEILAKKLATSIQQLCILIYRKVCSVNYRLDLNFINPNIG